MKKLIYWMVCLSVVAGMTSCAVKNEGKAKNPPKHIILVGFDGYSAYCLNQGAKVPCLRKMMAEGAYTLKNRSILPSSSACNWASMFMGAGPELHGFNDWGSQKPDLEPRLVTESGLFPNIFGLYRQKNPQAEIGYIFEWTGMKYFVDTLAMSYCLNTPESEAYPDGCLTPAVNYIKEKKPALCVVIFENPDGMGHTYGWDSPEYMANIEHQDSCLAQVVKAVEEAGIMDETLIIVSADHGGLNKGHGGISMNEMQTPLVFYGKGVKKGHEITESTMVFDIAGTMAWLLDITQPQVWIARPVTAAFE